MMFKLGPVILVLFGNVWIWKIFIGSTTEGLASSASAVLLIYSFYKKKVYSLLILSLIILAILQFISTEKKSLTNLDNDEQRIQAQRLKEYPPTYLSIFGKTLWFHPGEIERNDLFIGFSRLQKNFFENLDPNQYFFAGHPRQRVEVREFEKFPYVFLPFFIAGIYSAIHKGYKVFLATIPLLFLLSVIGNKNATGPFVLFPLFTGFIYLGLIRFLKFKQANILGTKDKFFLKILKLSFWVVVVIFVIQSFVYEFMI